VGVAPNQKSSFISDKHKSKLPWWLSGLMIFLVVVVAFSPNSIHWIHGIVGAFLVGAIAALRVRFKFLLTRLMLVEPVIIAVGLASLLSQVEEAFPLLVVVVKANLCAITIIIYSRLVPFYQVIRMLRSIGIGDIFPTVLMLMYRYLPLLLEEKRRLQRARQSRTFQNKHVRLWLTLATIGAALLARVVYRSERVYQAMRARGWN